MTVKKVFGKIHLWLGLASGLIVFVVALSGSLLVFEEELELLFNRKQWVVKKVLPQRKSYDDMALAVQTVYPGKIIKGITIFHKPKRTVLFRVGKNKEELLIVAVDPYTGQIQHYRNHHKSFFTIVLQLHRYLLMGKTGKTITGVSCLIFITLLISGLIIWWPQAKNAIRQRFRVKWKGSFKRVNWDFHAVFGFYAFIFLLIIAATGLVWSYPWVNKMIFVIADGKPPIRFENPVNTGLAQEAIPGIYENIVAETNRHYTFRGELTINIPAGDSLSIGVFKLNENVKLANVASGAWFDRYTGQLLSLRPYEKESRGMKVRRLVYPIHTGSLYGWPTKIVALIVSLFAASLPVTGTLIWLGRKKKAKKKTIHVKKAAGIARPQLVEV